MRHITALAIKLVSCFVLLWLIMGGIYGLSFGKILTITLVLGIVSYIIGDMILLRLTNNTIATIADFGLALFVIWFMSENLTLVDDLFTASLIATIGVTILEAFFHKYVSNNVINQDVNNRKTTQGNLRYQTEASEEIADINRKDKD